MIPSPGRIAHYRLGEYDATEINRRRADALAANPAAGKMGVMVHAGNAVREGDAYPMMIVKAWGSGDNLTETTSVNGQVFLDGNDTLWVTSRQQGDGLGQWSEPPRV